MIATLPFSLTFIYVSSSLLIYPPPFYSTHPFLTSPLPSNVPSLALVRPYSSMSIDERTRYNAYLHSANSRVDEKGSAAAGEMLKAYVEALKVLPRLN